MRLPIEYFQIFYYLLFTMTIIISSLESKSFKLDYFALLLSSAKPSKKLSSTQCIPNQLFSSYNQRNCLYSIVLWSSLSKCSCKCLALWVFKKNLYVLIYLSLALTFLSSALIFFSFALIYWSLILQAWLLLFQALRFWALYFWASLFGFHHFKSHLVNFLYFFDLDPIILDLYLQNICLVSLISMQCVLKQTSRQIYKDNVSSIKLGCKAKKRKQSDIKNYDQILKLDNEDWAS